MDLWTAAERSQANVVWFDGLGSAIVGGAVAALVAVFVTRAQLKHDRRMRDDEAREQLIDEVTTTVTMIEAIRRSELFETTRVRELMGLAAELRGELLRARQFARGNPSLLAWLDDTTSSLKTWLTDKPPNGYRAFRDWLAWHGTEAARVLEDPRTATPREAAALG